MKLLIAAVVCTLLGLGGVASAQDYPTRPVRVVIAFSPSGAIDILGRFIADKLSQMWGQQVVVENRPGGSGNIGAAAAAAAQPDGYTLHFGAQTLATNVTLSPATAFDPVTSFDPIILVATSQEVFQVSAVTPFKSVKEVIDYAKANPGKLTYGTSGTGGTPHLGTEMIAEKAGIKLTHVPFKGAAEADVALLGGHVMMIVGGTGNKQHVDAGKAYFLNIWTATRAKLAPEIPTLKELGYPYVIDSSFGLAGPKGMDPKIVAKLHDAFKKALEEPAVVETMAKYDMFPRYLNSEDYKKAVADVTAQEKAALEVIGLLKKD
jgi:tripartite-type tricarboxylate transporter receptor subunit TctC